MFIELLLPSDPAVSPGEEQRRARAAFPAIVSRSSLDLWKPGIPIQGSGTRILIGVATYSVPELRLLDRLNELQQRHPNTAKVDVFNTLDCSTHEAYAEYIPDLRRVLQTPVVGFWLDGQFSHSATGPSAQRLLEDYLIRGFHVTDTSPNTR